VRESIEDLLAGNSTAKGCIELCIALALVTIVIAQLPALARAQDGAVSIF
jgi:hypothetical protein